MCLSDFWGNISLHSMQQWVRALCDPFLVNYREVCLSLAHREKALEDHSTVVIWVLKKGWKGRNAKNSYCFIEDLKHRAISCSPYVTCSSLVSTSTQHLLAPSSSYPGSSQLPLATYSSSALSPQLTAPSNPLSASKCCDGDDGSEQLEEWWK